MPSRGRAEPNAPCADREPAIAKCFARSAREHADRTAVVSAFWQPTYRALDEAANRIGRALLSHPGGVGDRVALLARHDSPLVAGVLGVVKAGRCAVIVNPADPLARIVQTVRHAEATLIVADAEHAGLARRVATAAGCGTEIVRIDDHLEGGPTAPPVVVVDPGAMAFLVYTSGSTGTPKGVIRSHRNMMHNAARHTRHFCITPGDRLALLSSLSTGNGVSLSLTTLLSGATLCPFPVVERGIAGLAAWMQAAGVTIYSSSSSLFRSFMQALPADRRFPAVRLVRLSSEPAQIADVAGHRDRFPADCRFLHTLASSETGTITCAELTAADLAGSGRISVGRPVTDDVEILLVDTDGREVAAGEVGEVIVRSRYLASGYWRDPRLTAEKFTFIDGVGMFRSGDLARLDPRGQLEFVGRKDARLKIRGYRIDPLEVEAALRRQSGVAEVVAGQRARVDGEPQFVAWITRDRDSHVSATDLRTALREVLPSHAIPSDFIFLDRFPITPNGKIDRAQLRTAGCGRPPQADGDSTAPQTATEETLTRIWARAFQRATIGRDADFYDLGGDSLVAAGIAAHVHAEWGVEMPLGLFHGRPTLKDLAAAIDTCRRTGPPDALPAADRSRPLPLSFGQELIWNVSQTPAGLAAYTMANTVRLAGPLDVAALRGSMADLVARHEILRTTFHARDGGPVAVIHPSADVSLEIVDVVGHPDPERAARNLLHASLQDEPFDLGRLPLMRFWLVRLRDGEHWLLRAHHHILSDAWSWRVYLDELAALYEAAIQGGAARLPAAPQYADFAAWQRRTMDVGSAEFQRDVAWWAGRLGNQPPALRLPFERPTPCGDAKPDEGVIWWGMAADVSARLDRLAARHNATSFGVRLAVFAAALFDASGQRDLVVGTYATGRSRLELQGMFGMFANMVTLRLAVDPESRFTRWLEEVTETVAAATEHAWIPHQLLCQELAAAGNPAPEIRAIFSISDHHQPRSFGGLELTQVERTMRSMPWGFSMKLDQHNEDRCHTSFDARLHDPRGVRAFVDRYRELLGIFAWRPDLPLAAVSSIHGARRQAA